MDSYVFCWQALEGCDRVLYLPSRPLGHTQVPYSILSVCQAPFTGNQLSDALAASPSVTTVSQRRGTQLPLASVFQPTIKVRVHDVILRIKLDTCLRLFELTCRSVKNVTVITFYSSTYHPHKLIREGHRSSCPVQGHMDLWDTQVSNHWSCRTYCW